MNIQVVVLQIDKRGIGLRGVIIRHLVMPNRAAGTEKFVRWVAEALPKSTYLNIMAQYHVDYKAYEYPEIARGITVEEFLEAMDWADSPEGISHPVPIRATGKIPLGASGAYTDVVYSLINNYKLKYMGGYGTPPWPTGLSINPGTLIESFNDINNCYIESGTGSLELDYTYFKGLQNKQSFRINCSPGTPLVVRNMFDTPTNFGWVSNYAFWVYIPELASLDSNLQNDCRMALLISSSTNKETDFHEAMAVTVVGSAGEIQGPEKEAALNHYIARHPYLEDFARSPTCALVRVYAHTYILVKNFQHVMELHLDHEPGPLSP